MSDKIFSIKSFFRRLGSLLLEVVLYTIFVYLGLAIVYGLTILFNVNLESIGLGEFGVSDPWITLGLEYIPLLFFFSLAMYLTNTAIFKRKLSVTGFVKKGWFKDTGKGYALALVLVGLGFIILMIWGLLRYDEVVFDAYLLSGFLLLFLIQSAGEEVLSRSWMIPAIESRFGTWVALIISSSIFSIGHFGNPNVSTVGLINILLAGFMLGLFFLKFRNIWYVTGLHAGWNFIQASFFDFNVSGIDVYSLINTTPVGNEFFSGGEFGYEGSVVASAIQLIVITYLFVNYYPDMFKNRPDYSMNVQKVALGSEEHIDEIKSDNRYDS